MEAQGSHHHTRQVRQGACPQLELSSLVECCLCSFLAGYRNTRFPSGALSGLRCRTERAVTHGNHKIARRTTYLHSTYLQLHITVYIFARQWQHCVCCSRVITRSCGVCVCCQSRYPFVSGAFHGHQKSVGGPKCLATSDFGLVVSPTFPAAGGL